MKQKKCSIEKKRQIESLENLNCLRLLLIFISHIENVKTEIYLDKKLHIIYDLMENYLTCND